MTTITRDPRDTLPHRDVRPSVPRPRSYLSGAAIFGICAVLALILFLMLDARRRALVAQRDRPAVATQLPAPPPSLAVPPAPVPDLPEAPPPTRIVQVIKPPAVIQQRPAPVPSQIALPPQPNANAAERPAERASDSSPVMVFDRTSGTPGGVAGASGDGKATEVTGTNGDDAVRATIIRNRGSLIPQGTIIAAVLETPLNSDRPGLARAIISRDARSFDGSRVLIPRGSRVIGEFRAGGENGNQRRVLVTWTRLIRPDGVAIRIGSPATDALGGAGIAGRVNTHFFERFANAVLQSALTIGVEVASRSAGTGSNSVFVGVPGQLGSVGQQLLPNVTPRTTVKAREGAEVAIFVAHDLDFGGTPPVR